MGLLDEVSMPHRITVEVPDTVTQDDNGGTVQTWSVAYTNVPCQVYTSGGAVGDGFGGFDVSDSVTVGLRRPVISHGCRIMVTATVGGTNPHAGFYYLFAGGQGGNLPSPMGGGIPTFYLWNFTADRQRV